MKYLFTFFLIGFAISISCNNKYFPKGKSQSCNDYFKLIKKNWKEKSEGVFYVKPFKKYNDIIESSIYSNRACLIKLSTSQIEFLLGKPSYIFQPKTKGQTYNYCISYDPDKDVENCFKSNNSNGGSFTIVIDSVNIVRDVYFSPAPTGD